MLLKTEDATSVTKELTVQNAVYITGNLQLNANKFNGQDPSLGRKKVPT